MHKKRVAIPLTTRHSFSPDRLDDLIGKDIMVLHQKKVFVFIKEADEETILKWCDKDSMIVDFSDCKYLKVEYIPKEKRDPETNE